MSLEANERLRELVVCWLHVPGYRWDDSGCDHPQPAYAFMRVLRTYRYMNAYIYIYSCIHLYKHVYV